MNAKEELCSAAAGFAYPAAGVVITSGGEVALAPDGVVAVAVME